MPESPQKRARWRGSHFERRVAKLIHGVVCGRSKAVKVSDGPEGYYRYIQINPQQPPDVVNEWLSVECKYYKRLPKWLIKIMTQAIRNAPTGLTPVAWLGDREDGSRFVVMTERDFLDLHER
jgi:hypothetical protein